MANPTVYVDSTGIHAPLYTDWLNWLVLQYQGIYGSDVVLTPDTQDGQWLGILAKSMTDFGSSAVAVYNSFSPSTAVGVGLSSVVKVNGIAREVPTNSTADLLIGGTVGTIITGGYATDTAGNQWNLPSTVTIPIAGQIVVTATVSVPGAIQAAAGDISNIGTPTQGWQTVTNPGAAAVGQPIELDPALKTRQTQSTMLPSQTVAQGIEGAILALPGVTIAKAYDNDTGSTDDNGIPPHSLSVVTEGGDAMSIATIIANKKTPGCGTYGNTSEVITDSVSGIPKTISFMTATNQLIDVVVNLNALNGYTTLVGSQIQSAIQAYFDIFTPGDEVYLSRLYGPASLYGTPAAETFNIVSILICIDGGTPGTANIPMTYNQVAAPNTITINTV